MSLSESAREIELKKKAFQSKERIKMMVSNPKREIEKTMFKFLFVAAIEQFD